MNKRFLKKKQVFVEKRDYGGNFSNFIPQPSNFSPQPSSLNLRNSALEIQPSPSLHQNHFNAFYSFTGDKAEQINA